jgi:type II secretory pathway component PulF
MRFHYHAVQRDGRLVSGLIEAPSERSAQRDLLKRGMQPTALGLAAPAGGVRSAARRRKTISRRDLGAMPSATSPGSRCKNC